jgi:hypothetical protein
MSDYVKKHELGWNGVVEEYLEELGTSYAETLITEGKLPEWKDPEFRQEQLVTIMTVAMFGLPMKGFSVGNSYLMGENLRYDVKDPKTGKEFALTIPRSLHNELAEVINKSAGVHIDSEAIDEVLMKYEDKLDSK